MSQSGHHPYPSRDTCPECADHDVRLAQALADVGRWAELDDGRRSIVASAYLETHPDLVAECLSIPDLNDVAPYPHLCAAVADLLGRDGATDRVWIDGDDEAAVEVAQMLSNLAWSHA
jgi:hypothetical protein